MSSSEQGPIDQAIARRVSAGKHVVLADLRQENADAAAEVMLDAGFEVSTATVMDCGVTVSYFYGDLAPT